MDAGGSRTRQEGGDRTYGSVGDPARRDLWLRDAVDEFIPEQNMLRTRDGRTVIYDWLVFGAGGQINWGKMSGVKESIGKDGVCSNYSYATVDSTWEAIRSFRGGNAVLTNPSGAVKCGGAPQKIMYLADDRFRAAGVRDKTKITFASALPHIFAVEPYRATLETVLTRKEMPGCASSRADRDPPDSKTAYSGISIRRSRLRCPTPAARHPADGAAEVHRHQSLADKEGWVDVTRSLCDISGIRESLKGIAKAAMCEF